MDYFPSTPMIVDSNRILYTASPFARSSLLHLQEIGELKALQAHTSSRENLQSYLFFTVLKGAGSLSYRGRNYDLHEGSCIFIDCREPYSHTTDTDLWTICWIHFDGPSMASVYAKYCERGGRPVFVPEDSQKTRKIWTTLMATAKSSDYMRDMKINATLAELLVSVMAESWHPEEKPLASKRASVAEVREYIDQHYAEQITLDSLAAKFYINKYYLSKSFKRQFGQNISAYLQSVRITKAKQLIRFTDKTLDEIGEAVGITPARYFSEVFRAVEGLTPTQYRKQW